jgi:antitoxin YefM
MTTDSLANVKANFSSYVDKVARTHERVEITRNGTLAAVLISPDDLASLEETIAILSDPAARRAVSEGLDDILRGEVVSWDEVDGPQ